MGTSLTATNESETFAFTPRRDHGSRSPLDHAILDASLRRRPPNCVVAHPTLGVTPHRFSQRAICSDSFHGCLQNMSRSPSLDDGMNCSVQNCQSHPSPSRRESSFTPARISKHAASPEWL